MKLLSKRESGQALILVLVLLLIGGLTLPPLLALANTGLKSSQVYEQKTDELYTADAGVEDAIWKIIKDDPSLYGLEYDDPPYPYTQEINGLLVNVEVTKLSLVEGLISEEEYKPDSPHEDWGEFEIPSKQVTRDYDEGWVEYYCDMTFTYAPDDPDPEDPSQRQLVTVGAFFAPFPGDMNLSPYAIVYTHVITSAYLEDGVPETKIASGGFAFIWRWQENPCRGPIFSADDTGAVSFKFKIHDPDWSHSDCFLWATFKEQDVSYVTNAPGLYKWLIEATAGNTTVRSVIIEDIGALSILTWEIDPPE